MTSQIIRSIEAINQRLERARELVEAGKIHPVMNMENHFAVESSDGKGMWIVNGECGCPDSQQRSALTSGWCKHRLSVELYKESQGKASGENPPAA